MRADSSGSTPGIWTMIPSSPWRAIIGSAVPMLLRRFSMTMMAWSTCSLVIGIFEPLSLSRAWMRRVKEDPPVMSIPPLRRSLSGVAASTQRAHTPNSSTVPTLRFRRSISVAKYQKNKIIRISPVTNRVNGSSKKVVAASMVEWAVLALESVKCRWDYFAAATSFLWTTATAALSNSSMVPSATLIITVCSFTL